MSMNASLGLVGELGLRYEYTGGAPVSKPDAGDGLAAVLDRPGTKDCL